MARPRCSAGSRPEHYSAIQELTGASATTISRVSKSLNYGADGYTRILGRLAETADR
jgi:TrpR-related protein YerC/YecD